MILEHVAAPMRISEHSYQKKKKTKKKNKNKKSNNINNNKSYNCV